MLLKLIVKNFSYEFSELILLFSSDYKCRTGSFYAKGINYYLGKLCNRDYCKYYEYSTIAKKNPIPETDILNQPYR